MVLVWRCMLCGGLVASAAPGAGLAPPPLPCCRCRKPLPPAPPALGALPRITCLPCPATWCSKIFASLLAGVFAGIVGITGCGSTVIWLGAGASPQRWLCMWAVRSMINQLNRAIRRYKGFIFYVLAHALAGGLLLLKAGGQPQRYFPSGCVRAGWGSCCAGRQQGRRAGSRGRAPMEACMRALGAVPARQPQLGCCAALLGAGPDPTSAWLARCPTAGPSCC